MLAVNGEELRQGLAQELDRIDRDLLAQVNRVWDDWAREQEEDPAEMAGTDLAAVNGPLNILLMAAAREMQARVEARLDLLRASHGQELQEEKGVWENWDRDIHQEQEQYRMFLEKLASLLVELQARLPLGPDEQLAELPEPYRGQAGAQRQNLEIIARMFAALPELYRQRAPLFQTSPQPLLEVFNPGPVPEVALLEAALPKWPEIVSGWLRVPRGFLCRYLDRALAEYQEIRDRNYHFLLEAEGLLEKLRGANEGFLKRYLLPAVDGIERGKLRPAVFPEGTELSPPLGELWEKFTGIYGELDTLVLELLASLAVRRLAAARGDTFDVNRHNPVYLEEAAEIEAGKVLETARSGYLYRDELLRPVDVILAKKMSGGGGDVSQEAEQRG